MYDLSKYDNLKGYEGYYMINRDGEILSLKSNKKGGGTHPLKHKNGKNVSLTKDGKEKHISIARLLREQYDPPIDLTEFVVLSEFPLYMIRS